MAASQAQLCELCRQFRTDILKFNFEQQSEYQDPSRWIKAPTDSRRRGGTFGAGCWNDSFRHVASFASLVASALICPLCDMVLQDFRGCEGDIISGYLELYPFALAGRDGVTKRKFTAAFSEDPTPAVRWSPHPHTFQVAARRPWDSWPCRSPHEPTFSYPRAIPQSGLDDDVFETARHWIHHCRENHQECKPASGGGYGALPTRVIDVGTDTPGASDARLYISQGEVGPYAALSHCWGGEIPFSLKQDDLLEKQACLALGHMPRNFQDAVTITRKLGLRYLWIDALCIIQDSKEDWAHEAAQMAAVYAGSTVTISALESPSSNDGVLVQKRCPGTVFFNDELVVQKMPREMLDLLRECQLSSRCWCLQERLLAPSILHIGASQIYWECRQGYAQENGPWIQRNDILAGTSDLLSVRPVFMSPEKYERWGFWAWYRLVEDYSSRNITVQTDLFPALAGAAQVVRESIQGRCTFFAGTWVEDLLNGMLWGAKIIAVPTRKAPGFNNCHELRRRSERLAPTWSWASVAGPIGFNFGGQGDRSCAFLGVDMVAGEDDPMAPKAAGSVHLRGLVARMNYLAPGWSRMNVGSLRFADDPEAGFTGCVLDFDRFEARKCFGLLARWSQGLMANGAHFTGDVTLLVLEELPSGKFQRIGICKSTEGGTAMEQKVLRFADTEVEII